MSRIIEKPFDAAKKVIRSIFRGAPNVITTSDLNRQIEALKEQMDMMCDCIGCAFSQNLKISIGNVDTNGDGDLMSVSVRVESIDGGEEVDVWIKGVLFKFPTTALSLYKDHVAERFYLVVTASKRLVTYADDFTHDISGAKFADGSSLPAADNYVITDEKLELVEDIPENTLAVLARFEFPKKFVEKVDFYNYFYTGKGLYKGADENFFYTQKSISRAKGHGICPDNDLENVSIRETLNAVVSDLDNGVTTNKEYNVYPYSASETNTVVAKAYLNRVSKVCFVNMSLDANAFRVLSEGGLIIDGITRDYPFDVNHISNIGVAVHDGSSGTESSYQVKCVSTRLDCTLKVYPAGATIPEASTAKISFWAILS